MPKDRQWTEQSSDCDVFKFRTGQMSLFAVLSPFLGLDR